MLDKIITYSFYALFLITPLFWTSLNYELFEYNKMILTYGLTVLIVGSWVLKMINQRTFIFKRTPLDIPLLLFLGSQILSTIFSIDPHTSIWGYYSRSNGGLLSIISYLLLYWAYCSNMDKSKVLTTLKFGLASGLIISLYGILEHFGVSPSCIILRGDVTASCWIQDVQARVFATLGQPNWMAAYLAMLIFPALYFLLTATSRFQTINYYLLTIIYYLAFTFTYSRGPTLGLIGGMVIFAALYLRSHITRGLVAQQSGKLILAKPLLIILASFLAINLLFGSSLTSFRLVSKFAAPPRPGIALPSTSLSTQLENGGTESGQIRFIVWKGALDIFKHYPIFGSGVETFAYSYYQYRPKEHNLTSEWDFLYNKAHNEYLNYLATTGAIGFIAYTVVILSFVIWCLKRLLESSRKSQESRLFLLDSRLLTLVTLSAYTSYLIYNFFLFSVVIIAIFFYLFPALAFVLTEATGVFKWPKQLYPTSTIWRQALLIPHTLYPLIYRRPLYTKIAKGVVIFSTLYLLYALIQLWSADTFFNKGEKALEAGNPGKAYNLISEAVDLNRNEPFYRSELAFSAAQAATALKETDATLSAALKDEALLQMSTVLNQSPKNVSFWRTAIRTYFELATWDHSYLETTLHALDQARTLAPTDPKLYYNKALVLDAEDKKDEEVKLLQQALLLKPNYLEAIEQLKEATSPAKQK